MPSCPSPSREPPKHKFDSIEARDINVYQYGRSFALHLLSRTQNVAVYSLKSVAVGEPGYCCKIIGTLFTSDKHIVESQFQFLFRFHSIISNLSVIHPLDSVKTVSGLQLQIFNQQDCFVCLKNVLQQSFVLCVVKIHLNKLYQIEVICTAIITFLALGEILISLCNCARALKLPKSDMEVDETSKELRTNINNHLASENLIFVNLCSTIQREDDGFLNVSECEIMNEEEFSDTKSNVYVNEFEVKENVEESSEESAVVQVANNLVTSDTFNHKAPSNDEKVNGSQFETKLTITDLKPEPRDVIEDIKSEPCDGLVNETEVFPDPSLMNCTKARTPPMIAEDVEAKNIEEKTSEDAKEKEKEKVKEKEKEKEKDSSWNGSSSSQVSSSDRKYDSQSRSQQSSSSSSSPYSHSKSSSKDSKDHKHRSSSSNVKNNERSSSNSSKYNDSDKYKSKSSSEKSRSHSCHHKPEDKCRCKSYHSRHHSKSRKYESIKTQCSADEIAYELRQSKIDLSNPYFTRVPWVPHPQLTKLKYGRFYRVEVDRNGGASTVHLYMDEISHMTEAQMKECAIEFIKLSYSEDENECAHHVMGIVHGAAAYLPDLVDYMADHYPTLTVKTGSLASRDNHTTTMSQYRDEVYKTYSNGTFRYAPLDQLSICGVLGEEVGAYFPDFVARLEHSPFMKPVMPWSSLSVVQTDNPRESNDGPIFWVRPGEQMIPANEALKEGARPKKRRNNELDNLAYIGASRSSEARESLFMDRTKAHADQVGVDYGISNTAPTAAVGVLKSVNCGHPEHGNRATKDVVAFHAQDYNELLEILMLDLYEPPQTQCTKWIEVSKLNTLRREGIRYAHIQLHDNDVYYLPRKIIHQFQTISSVASVAWHIRYRDYFSVHGAPNLHTPTGINKGQVFYEKKNVAVYYPPISENELLASVTNPGSPIHKTPKKDFSPFKHSPRKNHKNHSPRVVLKKEKRLDSTPGSPNTRRETEIAERNCTPVKKQERSKSDETMTKSELGNGFSSKKSEKSESSSHRRSSGDHSSSKKERRENQDGHSSHRKEVKNLDSEFSGKKDKSKSERTPSKSKHDRTDEKRKSDETRHKSKRHDDSSKQRSHDKHEKRSKEHCISKGNEAKDESESLKRKNNDVQYYTPVKKFKDEVTENGGNDSNHVPHVKEYVSTCESEISVKIENSSTTESVIVVNTNGNESLESNTDDREECKDAENFVNSQETFQSDLIGFDLRQNVSFSCGTIIPNVPPPPLPPTPPPMNPPLPPYSPVLDLPPPPEPRIPSPPHPPDSEETLPMVVLNRLQENCIISKDKSNNVPLIKKMKKKLVKKPVTEGTDNSYDLLGDIMAKMDKK